MASREETLATAAKGNGMTLFDLLPVSHKKMLSPLLICDGHHVSLTYPVVLIPEVLDLGQQGPRSLSCALGNQYGVRKWFALTRLITWILG